MSSNFLQEVKILIVEDSEKERLELVSRLKKYFNNIIEAQNGDEAIEIFKLQNDIDLVISKIDMPKVTGIELLRVIRQSNFNLPFILISEKSDSKIILDAIDLNVNYFILKPIDINNLLQKIDFVCEKLIFEKRLENKRKEIYNYIDAVDNVALIFKMDDNGNITYMNKAMEEISGYTQNDLNNLKLVDLIHPNVSKKMIEETWEALRSGKLFKGDTKYISKNKEEFYLNTTVFKTSLLENQYITIAFLTTQENLKKRDFYKKVLQNIQDGNKKENQYKKTIAELSSQLKNQESFVQSSSHQIELEKKRALSKERQLNHYELQMENLIAKHEKTVIDKNEEIKTYIESVEEKRRKIDAQAKQIKHYEKDLDLLREKLDNRDKEIQMKNKRIVELQELLKNANKKNRPCKINCVNHQLLSNYFVYFSIISLKNMQS